MHNTITTADFGPSNPLPMANADLSALARQPRRPHHIEDWAERRGLSQADLARELEADKSVVNRWYSGTTPGVEYQRKLAALLIGDEEATESLFRHPDDDWLARFFAGRDEEEIERIKRTLEAAFPRRAA